MSVFLDNYGDALVEREKARNRPVRSQQDRVRQFMENL